MLSPFAQLTNHVNYSSLGRRKEMEMFYLGCGVEISSSL